MKQYKNPPKQNKQTQNQQELGMKNKTLLPPFLKYEKIKARKEPFVCFLKIDNHIYQKRRFFFSINSNTRELWFLFLLLFL